jgi:Raf kinase inhibitor-like YbhB/YbcL family protein
LKSALEETGMTTIIGKSLAVLALATLAAGSAAAQNEAAPSGGPVLAKDLAPAKAGSTRLRVRSTAMNGGGAIDDQYTQNGENMSPPLSWSKGPAGTISYVVLAEDAGVNRPDPVVHWVVYNIPRNTTALGEDMPKTATLPNGASQGLNVRNQAGFIGPKPPAGQTHPYHFEVFALNKTLRLDPAKANRKDVVDAMKNSVLASGEFVANYTGK